MAFQLPYPQLLRADGSFKRRHKLITRLGSGFVALSLGIGTALPTFAADPFRANTSAQQREIGSLTESAFEAIFKEGNYVEAMDYLGQADTSESDEPLVHAMMASMDYLRGDFDGVSDRARMTQESADALKESDRLRGHLYAAVGTFLEGAYILKTEGVARGTPTALGMLQEVFSELDEAEAMEPDDPELNLLKGYMDLMLAVNLPFSNPEEAIARMEEHGSPVYLAQRGIALGHRDLGNYDEALIAVNKALAAAGQNPELHYLKGQILAKQGAQADSKASFDEALKYSDQLPTALVKQIAWEGCAAAGQLSDTQCAAVRSQATGAF